MKVGMLHLFENPVGKTEHQIIQEQMSLTYEAENLGFDSVWPAEHHFSECGDVDHCVEKLRRVTQEYGFNEMLCWTRIGGLETRKVLRAMELMSGEVMPRLRNEMKEAA
jgi:hypothetical protein